MSISEEKENQLETQPPEGFDKDIPLFVLPKDEDILLLGQSPIEAPPSTENVPPVENNPPKNEQPEINFQFSSFDPKPQKIKVAAAPVESPAETIRKSGLAWSAAIVFFGSVVFMLVLGWFADLLFGSSPWGIVVGIVLGSLIGFMQFFRITSKILNSSSKLENTPLNLNDNSKMPERSGADDDNFRII